MVLCVLGLGSNKPYNNLSSTELIVRAAGELQNTLTGICLSPLYKTAPLYITDQAVFYNAAVSAYFDEEKPGISGRKSAGKLLGIIQEIEACYGRDRSTERRWGERSLDIDILLFGDQVISKTDLVIPHPRLKERAFALRPLLDLLPNARDPGTGIAYSDILAGLGDQDIVKLS